MTSSVAATSTRTSPTAERTTTVSPSRMPRAARSSGCASRAWRGRPRVSRAELCSHELLSRWWRRPMSSSSPSPRPGAADSSASRPGARRARAGSRGRSAGRASRSRSGSRGFSGPRSAPAGIPSSLATDSRAPDERSSASSCRRGVSRSRASASSVARDHRSRRPLDRSRSRATPRSRAISQSCRGPGVGLEERRRPPGRVAHREGVEDEVVVVALERARSAAG